MGVCVGVGVGVCVCAWVCVCVWVGGVCVCVRIAAKLQSRMFTSEHSETFPKIVLQILFVRLSYGVRDLSKYFSISEASASCLLQQLEARSLHRGDYGLVVLKPRLGE